MKTNFFSSILFGIILGIAGSNTALAQWTPQPYLYVYPSNLTAYPDHPNLTNNANLAAIFVQYQVSAYYQSFPGCQTQELQNAYEVHCNGNIDGLKKALELSGLFSFVEKAALYYPANSCPTSCPNPVNVNDPSPGYQLDITEARCAWEITKGDPSVVIAVVDTEFDLNNPDLQGKFVSVTGTNGTYIHGTPVSGMIVAAHDNNFGCAGLAPDCRLAGYVVTSSPWNSIWQAYLDGRRIINVSYRGIGLNNVTTALAVKEMTENGTLIVGSAGNEDPGVPAVYSAYANIPGMVIASSVSYDGSVHQWVDYNEYVDICAPGNGVSSLVAPQTWGTSFSAPAVCAAAGLILSVNNCLTPAEIENILKATACPMIPPPQVQPNWVGAGYLNMYQAVLMAQGRSGTLLQSETWSDVVYVPSNLVIPSGVTLTITGSVRFSQGAGLVIMPGGQVHLHGTLTSSCMASWNGVTVKGLVSESQYTAGMHGQLHAYNGAIIENAVIGVELVEGGIIYAMGANFKNNGTGVKYQPYSNFWPNSTPPGQQGQPRNYFGSINDCTFLFNDEFKKAAPIGAGIEMLEVRGISIRGCTFINARTIKNPQSNADYGYGLKATDARFSVTPLGIGSTYPPSGYIHSKFEGLGYGVYVGTAQSGINSTINTSDDFVNVPFTVEQAAFSGCIYGIHNRFVSQGTIVGNTFKMGTLPPVGSLSGNTPFTNIQIGVFIENGANGFELQENQFFKTEDNVEYAYGTYCQNLGWFNNRVRRNNYVNVDAGNLADENNAITGSVSRGLYYLCNTNTTQAHDFYVYSGSDIRFHQGMENGPGFIAAGNTFTKANAPKGDFENNGPTVRYYHHGLSQRPLYHAGLLFINVNSNPCETQHCFPPCHMVEEWAGIKSEYQSSHNLYLNAVAEMEAALLSGNTVRAEQQSNLAAGYRLRLDELSAALSLYMAIDTTTYSLDSVRIWWQKMESPVSDMVLARDYLAKGQNSMAFAFLDGIPTR